MKKSTFLDLVCARLHAYSIPKAEIEKQRAHIDAYLSRLGIGEESDELDYEDPDKFADGIYEIISEHLPKEDAVETDALPNEDEQTDDITFADQPAPIEEIVGNLPEYDEAAEEDIENADEEYYPEDVDPSNEAYISDGNADIADDGSFPVEYTEDGEYPLEDVGGETREYDISELGEGECSEEDASDEDHEAETVDDMYYEELPTVKGNSALFWILFAVLSPIWLPIAASALVLAGIAYLVLLAFKFLYIPMTVCVILFGSVMGLAEFVYGVVKIIGKSPEIGLFELGICFAIVSLTIGLTLVISILGTRIAPIAVKNSGKFIKKMKKKIKWAFYKVKGACSI